MIQDYCRLERKEKKMKKVKILTITLLVAVITMVAFIGVYTKVQNRMENQVKDYDLAMDLKGSRNIRLKVSTGNKTIIKDAEGKENSVIISDIVENYIYHYVYMPKNLYEELYGEYNTNVLFAQNNVKDEQEEELASKLLKEPNVNAVSLSSNMENVMDDMMRNLNYVVIILIVSAGMLAFVVLYNLANINISERIRELASLKVLGFYDKEVYDYVTRETAILTAIGIIFGLIGGYFLSVFIVKTCEINVLRFGQEIKLPSYIYSVAITVIFTVIVNIVTYFALKKIDMIESLKSIE